jgi:hypothetical protein
MAIHAHRIQCRMLFGYLIELARERNITPNLFSRKPVEM